MRLTADPEVEKFRAEFSAFLDAVGRADPAGGDHRVARHERAGRRI
jgi:hypothetical protein